MNAPIDRQLCFAWTLCDARELSFDSGSGPSTPPTQLQENVKRNPRKEQKEKVSALDCSGEATPILYRVRTCV